MALDTYANLKAALVTWSGRNDINDVIDDVIDLVESEIISNESQPLRIREMEARAQASALTTSRFLALPDGFLEMRKLKVVRSGNDTEILYRTPAQLQEIDGAGIPRFYTVTTQLEFDRKPDSAYTLEMQYYKKITALSDSNTTNDILTNYPQIYLQGCLWAINQFSAEEEKSEFYYNKFISSIRGANKRDMKGRFGVAPVMRGEGSTP